MARPRGKIQRVGTGLRMQPHILKALRHQAVDEGATLSAVVERAAVEYLQNQGVDIQDGSAGEDKPVDK